MGGCPAPFVQAGLSKHDSLAPTMIRGDGDGFSVDVEFSEPLQPATLTLANWSWRVSGEYYICMAATISGNHVFLQGTPDEAEAGPDALWYNAVPPDIQDLAGNPAVAFAARPIND